MSLYFLDYLGKCELAEKNEFEHNRIFTFKNGKINAKIRYLVPIIYDVSFKKVFYYDEDGAEIVRDFLNSILFPESNSIIEVKFLPKEILSNSHLKNNKGTKKVDNAYIAKIRQKKLNENNDLENNNSNDNIEYKNVIIDIEMENSMICARVTGKCFNYGSSLRMRNDFIETWVIALCIDKSKNPESDKGAQSYFGKKYNISDDIQNMNYVTIYEIYLNGLYNSEDELVSVLNNEKIGAKGKEWIKLFCLKLWCDGFNNINYYIPEKLNFYGDQISKAIDILTDFQNYEKTNIQIQLHDGKQKNEEIEQKGYDNGFNNGFNDGFNNGFRNGFDCGFDDGYDKGYDEKNAKILDSFYKAFKEKKILEGNYLKELLDVVSYSFLIGKYGQNSDTEEFAKILALNGLLK